MMGQVMAAKKGQRLSDLEEDEAIVPKAETSELLAGKNKQELLDSFYDPETDYSLFSARVTDRDESGNVFKLISKNLNVKFFRAGDYVEFQVPGIREDRQCGGYIRSSEGAYFVLYVKDLYPCWPKGEYFRRGTIVDFKSDLLAKRVKDAAIYRVLLLRRREAFLKQLNDINHFLWSYDQQRVLLASEYDKKMEEIKRQKQKALEGIVSKKQDQIHLQKELMFRLDSLDQDLEFYRVDRHELGIDRWSQDHHLGLPVAQRPQELKKK